MVKRGAHAPPLRAMERPSTGPKGEEVNNARISRIGYQAKDYLSVLKKALRAPFRRHGSNPTIRLVVNHEILSAISLRSGSVHIAPARYPHG